VIQNPTIAIYAGTPPGDPALVVRDPAIVRLLLLGLHHQLQTTRNGRARRADRARRAA
jgi:hypothetical protein